MVRISFDEMQFSEEKTRIKCIFQDFFVFYIEKADLTLGRYEVQEKAIIFKDAPETKAKNKLNRLFDQGFEHMTSIYGRKGVYIHSGIPLIGTQYFGLVDRGSSIIELRPITGCNLNCIYCSVDEGLAGRKTTDFFVEKDYMVSELRKLVEFKQCDIEAHINPQGEPLLYRPLPELISDISAFVSKTSIDTNGVLLTEDKLRELQTAGLTQINVSLNAIDAKIASKLAGCRVQPEKILKNLEKTSIDVIIAPILVPGVNDKQIEKLIVYCKEKKFRICIQNFLKYKFGRNPVKPWPMDRFMKQLGEWEQKYQMKLIVQAEDFNIIKTKELSKPFKKNDIVQLDIVCPGRKPDECIGMARNRCVTVGNCGNSRKVKAKIIRTKHNIFNAIK